MKKVNFENTDIGIDLENFSLEDALSPFRDVEPLGWKILVRLYIQPQKLASGLFLPEVVQDEQKYQGCTGLVVRVSKDAYKDARYADTGDWCKEGDWVVFPRHAGYRVCFYGLPVWVLSEDAVDVKVPNPTIVTR